MDRPLRTGTVAVWPGGLTAHESDGNSLFSSHETLPPTVPARSLPGRHTPSKHCRKGSPSSAPPDDDFTLRRKQSVGVVYVSSNRGKKFVE